MQRNRSLMIATKVVLTICLFLPLKTISQENILDQKLSITIEQVPLYKALIQINQATGYKFSYNSNIFNEDRQVSLQTQNMSIRRSLDSLLNDTTLRYQVLDRHIIIHRQDSTPRTPPSRSNPSQYITLSGKIIDKMSGEPLSYANIGIFNKSLGTVSNIDGEFILKLPEKLLNDTMVVSYMGYKNHFLPLRQMKDKDVIRLEKKNYTIQEVIVRIFDAQSILHGAFDRIRDNYYFKPVVTTGFYRETIKRKKEYTSVSEAVVDVYKPYNKLFQSPKIKMLKSRKSTDVNRKDSITLKLKAGMEAVLLLDPIHENLSFFTRTAFDQYNYNVVNISHYDGHNTYVIEFSPARESEMTLYTGKLYIDVRTMALVRAEFHLDRENLNKIASSLIIKKKWDIHVNPQSVDYYVSYRRVRDKYFLSQIRGDLNFKVRRKNQLFADQFTVSFNMLASNVDTNNVSKFERGDIFKPHQVFIEQITEYDPSFWGSYNYIKPDEPLEETVNRLGSKINMLQEE